HSRAGAGFSFSEMDGGLMALRKAGNIEGEIITNVNRQSRYSLWHVVIVAAIASLLLGLPVLAALTGDLQGTAFDPKGALIEGAKVTIRSMATGVAREVTSDSRGEFAALQLEVGTYEVRIEKTGFRTISSRAEIRSGEQTRLNVNLELGQVS